MCILHSPLGWSYLNMQPTSASENFAVLSKCGFLLHHCQSQPQSFLFQQPVSLENGGEF